MIDGLSTELRAARGDDADALRRLHEEAFGQAAEASLVAALLASHHDRVSLVALVNGRVVGHVLLT